jgi:hypothetical protein
MNADEGNIGHDEAINAEEPGGNNEGNMGNGDAAHAGVAVSDTASEGSSDLRRSARNRRAPALFDPARGMNQTTAKGVTFEATQRELEQCHNIMVDKKLKVIHEEYDTEIAGVAARIIHSENEKAHCFGQQYILQKGMKKFGAKGKEGVVNEVSQLHNRECFKPLHVHELSLAEKKKAQEALVFLTEKKDDSVKGRLVYNGKPTRAWHGKDESASPTASNESIYLTATIDAHEERDVMTSDIPNAFIQANMPTLEEGEERVIMKMSGTLVETLVELAPEIYGPYVVIEKGRRVIYLQVLRALYGMLVAALLWYRQFRAELEGQGFVFNPYDPCVANRWVDHKQHTIRFHVDDIMSSHVDPKVNDSFLAWLNEKYGTHGEVKATRGHIHDYLGMTFDFSHKGKVVISMVDYMERIVDEFPHGIDKTATTPAADDLFLAQALGQCWQKKNRTPSTLPLPRPCSHARGRALTFTPQ